MSGLWEKDHASALLMDGIRGGDDKLSLIMMD